MKVKHLQKGDYFKMSITDIEKCRFFGKLKDSDQYLCTDCFELESFTLSGDCDVCFLGETA